MALFDEGPGTWVGCRGCARGEGQGTMTVLPTA